MAIRTLDTVVGLLVIDFQEGTRRFTGEAGPAAFAAAAQLATAFRKKAFPVVMVRMAGGPGGRTDVSPEGSNHAFPPEAQTLVPELNTESSDLIVSKSSWGAFLGTDLKQRLEELAVTQVVVCGTAASIGVESTARQAYELGFNVTVALDAITDFNPAALKSSAEIIFPMLAETGNSEDIIRLLSQRH